MRTLFVSCGHNNARNWIKDENGRWVLGMARDNGAVDKSDPKMITEYRWVRKVASQIEKFGSKNFKLVILPEGLNLNDRVAFINKKAVDGDICVELHMNSGGGTGVETLAHADSAYALNKAKIINDEIASVMTTLSAGKAVYKNRGAKKDTVSRFGRLGFIRDTKPTAFLIELGFIDSSSDRDLVWLNGGKAVMIALEKAFPL